MNIVQQIVVHSFVSSGGSTLFVYNPLTNSFGAIGNAGQALTDIAITPSGAAYAVGFGAFYRVNLATGAATLAGSLSPLGYNALTSDAQGNLFTAEFNSTRIQRLDPETGQRTLFATTSSGSAGDLIVFNNRLWLATNALTLESYDLTTGQPLGSLFHGISNVFGLAIGADGQLYGFADNRAYVFDTATGAATLAATFQPGLSIGGATQTATGIDSWFVGSAQADFLSGTARNEFFAPHAGNDVVNGGEGTDAARLDGNRTNFTVAKNGTEWQVAALSGNSGSDRLVSIERLLFDDQQVGLQPIPDASAPAYNSQPGFLFDEVFYLLSNPELVPTVAAADALAHYLNVGSAQGLQPNSWFDANYYEARWDDLDRLNLTDAQLFQHYNLYGVWEGRSAGPDFDGFNGTRYLANNGDVAGYVDANIADFLGSRTNGAIAHFIIYGANEGRLAYDVDGTLIDLGYIV